MSDQQFESVDQIEKVYTQRLLDTPEDQRLPVELEKARAVANFHAEQAQNLKRQAWIGKALSEFPNARMDDLRGDSEQDILAAAKSAHERVEELVAARLAAREKEIEAQVGRRAYGGATGAGGAPVVDEATDDAIIARTYNAYNTGRMTPKDRDDLMKVRVGQLFGVK